METQSDAGAPYNWPPLSSASDAGSEPAGQTPAGKNEFAVEPPALPEFPVSPQYFDAACKEIGVVKLNMRQLAAFARVGDTAKKLGVIKIGRGKLLAHDDQLDDLLATCRDVLQNSTKPELKIAAASIMQKLLAGLASSAKDMIKSAEIDLSDQAQKPNMMPSFLPFKQVIPVQQNVQVNVDTDKKSVETRLDDQQTGSERPIPDSKGTGGSQH